MGKDAAATQKAASQNQQSWCPHLLELHGEEQDEGSEDVEHGL